MASVTGWRLPAANGAIVKGIRAAAISLITSLGHVYSTLHEECLPLKSPMIAAMGRRG